MRRLTAIEWSVTHPDWWSFGGGDRSFPMDIGFVWENDFGRERRIGPMTSFDA